VDVCFFKLHEESVITHPAIALDATNETVAAAVHLDE
jgi:hypothetical protein